MRITRPVSSHGPAGTLFFTELLLFGWVETKRLMDLRNPGSQGDGSFFGITDELKGKENGYPGKACHRPRSIVAADPHRMWQAVLIRTSVLKVTQH